MVRAGRCGQAAGPHRCYRRHAAARQAQGRVHPHVDCGDFVIVINADKAILTGKKLTQKYYRHHTGWVGGLKEVQYKTLMTEKPEFAMQLAVKGMLPKNSIGRQSATRLKVFAGENHNHQAQKPEVWDK